MPMIIYKPLPASPTQFVEFWSLRYRYAKEHLYNDNIGQELSEERIFELYEWKNGTPLSDPKRVSVYHNFVEHLGELTQLKSDLEPTAFLAQFPNGGAIWRIFWLHCWQPLRFPIYDQHVHRAMAFIVTGLPEEIPVSDQHKIHAYIHGYLPFHGTFHGIDSRSVDKALWAFGKFLKEAHFPVEAQNDA
jgi:hypothetical protein